jgi:hypothetical protein
MPTISAIRREDKGATSKTSIIRWRGVRSDDDMHFIVSKAKPPRQERNLGEWCGFTVYEKDDPLWRWHQLNDCCCNETAAVLHKRLLLVRVCSISAKSTPR